MIPTPPKTFEQAMSSLVYGIGSLEVHPPVTKQEIARVRFVMSRMETAVNLAARRLETVE